MSSQDITSSVQRQESVRGRRAKQRELIGAIDQGTSSTRFLVFENRTGHLVASSQVEIQRIVPKEGWVEIDPNAIMNSVHHTIAKVHDQLIEDSASSDQESLIKCIGICNQRESTVVWDSRTGEALYNVIVWMDNRTKELVDKMSHALGQQETNQLKEKTGLPMSTYFSAFKLKWLIDNVDRVKEALKRGTLLFGTVDSWILWNLTGKHSTDVTNASRTFLMNIEKLEWDKTLCKHFNVPMTILPKILSSADDFGVILHGPLQGLPVTGVIGDQSGALFGHSCLQAGQTKATFGTGCFIMQNIGSGSLSGALTGIKREARTGLITTIGYKIRDKPVCYALEGSVKIAGAALTWLRDNMQLIQNYEECDELINKTTNAAGVFFVPALGGLYSPYWDPNAAGLYIGLSQFSRREHLVRATFDAIAFQTNDILSLMRGVTSGLMIDGGLCKSENMCQILADVTGCDIMRPSMCEISALGAAMIAALGAGLWSYESMLVNANASHLSTYSSSANQNHHYPHASLNYDGKFTSSMIQNKNDFSITSRTSACNMDAGGGVDDDAGGGWHLHQHQVGRRPNNEVSSQMMSSDSESEDGVTISGEFLPLSRMGDHDDHEHIVHDEDLTQGVVNHQATGNRLDVIGVNSSNCVDALNGKCLRHYAAAPSSGYSSGDNFEVSTNAGSCNNGDLLSSSSAATTCNARHSPISPCQLQAVNCCATIICENTAVEEDIANREESEIRQMTSVYNCSSPSPPLTNEEKIDVGDESYLCDDDDSETSSLHSEPESAMDCQSPTSMIMMSQGAGNKLEPVTSGKRQMDVYHPYISLEHRTELVENWRRAVERSMKWTKMEHEEETRQIDHQRLSSLPISVFLFSSIGILALSGLLSRNLLSA